VWIGRAASKFGVLGCAKAKKQHFSKGSGQEPDFFDFSGDYAVWWVILKKYAIW
jgi:hypothetical protein